MQVTCPEGHTFEIVSSNEMKEMGLAVNTVARARKAGIFPEPWAEFENRHIWLRDAILDFITERALRRWGGAVDPMFEEILQLPQDERQQVLGAMREKFEELTNDAGRSQKKR